MDIISFAVMFIVLFAKVVVFEILYKYFHRYLHYISSDGFHMYVGNNNLQNDRLTFKFANAKDLWFHAKDMPGSHVIVKLEGEEDVPDATYEAIGPHFQNNPYGLDKDVLVRHGTISIDIPEPSFEGIRRGLELVAMEGIVFWHEGAPLCKIKRTDFGFKWPVTQSELNAEFGANNPDPCELVRRTATMYSRHELPVDTTKMFEAEHEATKEEAKA